MKTKVNGKLSVLISASVFCLLEIASATEIDSTQYRAETLKPGEDLSALSFRLYGTHKRWREIAKLNKESVPDPNHVKPGIVVQVSLKGIKTAEDRVAVSAAAPQTADAPSTEKANASEAKEVLAEAPVKKESKKKIPATLVRVPAKIADTSKADVSGSSNLVSESDSAEREEALAHEKNAPASKITRLKPFKMIEIE